MMKRYLEIGDDGIAFHEPAFDHPFSTGAQVPPVEVLFCDCAGIGRICHHRYANGHQYSIHGMAVLGMQPHPDAAAASAGAVVPIVSQEDWKLAHSGPRCRHRRQIFVDVTDRPDAQRDMRYDEASDTFAPTEGPPT